MGVDSSVIVVFIAARGESPHYGRDGSEHQERKEKVEPTPDPDCDAGSWNEEAEGRPAPPSIERRAIAVASD